MHRVYIASRKANNNCVSAIAKSLLRGFHFAQGTGARDPAPCEICCPGGAACGGGPAAGAGAYAAVGDAADAARVAGRLVFQALVEHEWNQKLVSVPPPPML